MFRITTLVLIFGLSLAAQSPIQLPATRDQKPSVQIAGSVLDVDTGKPLPHARVDIRLPDASRQPLAILTDDQGRFSLRNGPPGSYSMTASRPTYITSSQPSRPSSLSLNIGYPPTDKPVAVKLFLRAQAALVGTVLDSDGKRVAGQIHLFRLTAGNGRLHPANGGRAPIAPDGSFRASMLPPGRYYALFSPERSFNTRLAVVYPTELYPGVASLDAAQVIELAPGDTKQVHFKPKPQASYSIQATLPARQSYGQVRRIHTLGVPFEETIYFSYDQNSGAFRALNLLPGRYVFTLDQLHIQAAFDITSRDIDNLNLVWNPLPQLSGSVRREKPPAGAPAPFDRLPSPSVVFRESSGNAFQPQGETFDLAVPPGTYQISPPGPPWYVRSAYQSGHDLLREGLIVTDGTSDPVNVVLSYSSAKIAYKASSALPEVVHVAFLRRRWQDYEVAHRGTYTSPEKLRQMTVISYRGTNGRVDGLPPGDYLVLAWSEEAGDASAIEQLPYNTEEFQRKYGDRAHRLTLHDFDDVNLQLERLLPPEAFVR
jgi:hypothetical protein